MKHTSVLMFSLGLLKLRPPAPAMQHMMDCLGSGLDSAAVGDLLQVCTDQMQ
jgi:hypothetical protein